MKCLLFSKSVGLWLTVVVGLVVTCDWQRRTHAATPDKTNPSIPIAWNANQIRINDLEFQFEDDSLVLTTTGDDPFIQFEMPAAPVIDRDWFLSMETFCTKGIARMHFYTGRRPTQANHVVLPDLDSSEGWTTYDVNLSRLVPKALNPNEPSPVRIDFGTRPGIRLSVRNVRLRRATDREYEQLESESRIRRQKEELDQRINQYYTTSTPVSIDRIEHQAESISIKGHVEPGTSGDQLWLVPRRAEEISAVPIKNLANVQKFPIALVNNGFELKIPTGRNAPMRYPGVRFQVVHQTTDQIDMVSAARYPDQLDIRDARDLSPTPPMQAAKGLTCLDIRFTADQIRDLGLTHGNINIVMNDLIRKTPSPGYEPITLRGREIYYNLGRARVIDRNVQMLRRADLTVAAILLVGLRNRSHSPIVHPDADPAGVYSMPNLTSGDAADVYALTCDFLADRYCDDVPSLGHGDGTNRGHGRIDHWIVHNEVDAGWSWTNMGEQPMNVFLDHYFRSMRIVDAAVRARNPHGRAFISLTHMWNQGDPKPWRWYPAKAIMEALLVHCQTEGDFPWGLAFHPYPESLWEADTWNDDVEDHIETAKITIKNIEVLDRYMHTERVRQSDGAVRPVLLSEQGFHAPADKPERLQVQAAALLYTFEKLRQCPSILAFDYHRPVDHPNEGGLRLGLRGLSSREHPIGEEKPAWNVYRAIGTDAEADLLDQYRHHWQTSN